MKNLYGCFFDCHVVRACEIKYTSAGVAIGNFSIAVNDSAKKDGQWVEDTSFFECVAYGKVAETLKNYVTSGKRMFFNMRPKQERWIDKDGKKRSRVVFIVNDFSFGEKPRGAQNEQAQPGNVPPVYGQNQQQYSAPQAPQQAQNQQYNPAPAPQSPTAQAPVDDLFDGGTGAPPDDIPVF